MKITDIRLVALELGLDPPFHAAWDPTPRRRFPATIVCVDTDEGLTGVGSGDAMLGFEQFRHLFIGTDPLAIARQVRTIETIDYHAARYWPLEAALWDIIGQACGQPVATLFGGAMDRVPVYASWGERRSAEQRVEDAHDLVDAGFRAVKLRIDPAHHDLGLATVAALRDALADELAVLVDLNQGWRMPGDLAEATDAVTTRRLVSALGELGVGWVEEPLPEQDVRGLAALRQATGVAIAGGEMVRSVDQLLALLDADALDVFQPDVVLAVGMYRARMIAELVRHRHRAFTPHSWTNGIGVLANLHVTAGVGGGPWFEFPYDPPGWTPERRDFMLARPVMIEADGCLPVGAAPGLGIELDVDALRRHRC